MNNFTKGVWSVKVLGKHMEMDCSGHYGDCIGTTIMSSEEYYPWNSDNIHDWYMQAAAMNTATTLANQGYDAQKVIELLPELLAIFDDGYLDVEKSTEVWEWLDRVVIRDEEES